MLRPTNSASHQPKISWPIQITIGVLCGVAILSGCQPTTPSNSATNTVHTNHDQASDAQPVTNTAEIAVASQKLTIVAPESEADHSAFIQVSENNLNVTQVAAEDSPGSTLIYRLQDGEDKDKFTLNEQTGTLQFKTIPDWEQPTDADANNNYMLLWQVVSSSGDARSQFLVVQVTDIPE